MADELLQWEQRQQERWKRLLTEMMEVLKRKAAGQIFLFIQDMNLKRLMA